jgi:hypothetical protein
MKSQRSPPFAHSAAFQFDQLVLAGFSVASHFDWAGDILKREIKFLHLCYIE